MREEDNQIMNRLAASSAKQDQEGQGQALQKAATFGRAANAADDQPPLEQDAQNNNSFALR